jgi:hypothetical protein
MPNIEYLYLKTIYTYTHTHINTDANTNLCIYLYVYQYLSLSISISISTSMYLSVRLHYTQELCLYDLDVTMSQLTVDSSLLRPGRCKMLPRIRWTLGSLPLPQHFHRLAPGAVGWTRWIDQKVSIYCATGDFLEFIMGIPSGNLT